MTPLHYTLILLVAGVLLAAQTAHGQLPQQLPQQLDPPPLLGTLHHVLGRVERVTGGDSLPLNGTTLNIHEFWYILGNNGIVIPRDVNGVRDPLTANGHTLVQGRVIGHVTLTSDAEPFEIQWRELIRTDRVPWIENVQNNRTGARATAYNILQLNAVQGSALCLVEPVPLIMLFGSETTKNVGKLHVNCFRLPG